MTWTDNVSTVRALFVRDVSHFVAIHDWTNYLMQLDESCLPDELWPTVIALGRLGRGGAGRFCGAECQVRGKKG